MRVLTFNWHEAYVSMLARAGGRFDVVERLKGGSRAWMYGIRPLPPNARIVKPSTARQQLRARAYDAVICHNPGDLRWLAGCDVPKLLVFHNKLTTELALGGRAGAEAREAVREDVKRLAASDGRVRLVFISASKRDDWGLDGEVILPGIDLADYGGYEGGEARVLRVGNLMKARDLMLGWSAQQAILAGIPSTLLGLAGPGEGGRPTGSWDELRAFYRSHRVFLNTTVDPYEDGYNLAMLEAMATGMPVATTANCTSPITDGADGIVSADCASLAAGIRRLLDDQAQAARLGAAARATVGRLFPHEAFVANWTRAIEEAARPVPVAPRPAGSVSPRKDAAGAAGPWNAARGAGRLKILLSYVAYPATTARYFERSLRACHDVVTIGPRIPEALVRAWNLEAMREPVSDHDLPAPHDVDLARVVGSLPARWQPDLFLWIESVPGNAPRGVARLDCPTACYVIDSHLDAASRAEWASRFDWVFLAQRAQVADFVRAGCARVRWLPLACDPGIHGRQSVALEHDVSFVGSVTGDRERRRRLLEVLGRRVRVHVERSFLRDMARTFSASRIVFNEAVSNDLNMRVFEALASGALLLTDRAPGSGLDELFRDGEHLAIYDDEAGLEELAERYLRCERERVRVAEAGRLEVLRHHTYDHRAAALVRCALGGAAPLGGHEPGSRLVDDPVLLEGLALQRGGRWLEALERIDLAGRGRELNAWEAGEAAAAAAACLRALGRGDEAARRERAALDGMAADDRRVFRTWLDCAG